MFNNNDDWQAQADRRLWTLVTKQIRAAERHVQALSGGVGAMPHDVARYLAGAQGSAAIAHARELARFCCSSDQRRLARRAINRTAHALRETLPNAG